MFGFDGAYNNLSAEIVDWDFDKLKTSTRRGWNDILGRIRIYDTEVSIENKEVFYTSLYRALLYPNTFSDQDNKYIGFNDSIYTTDTVKGSERRRKQYQYFSGWDTYRSQMQLVTLIGLHISSDMAQSLINNSKLQ